MESTSQPNRIQLSNDTAEKLREAGKEDWLIERLDTPQVKGKGKILWVPGLMTVLTAWYLII